MTNTLKHLALLARMESSGLKLGLTGKFPEDALDQTCERVETFQLQNRLRTGNDNTQIQKELVRTPEFAALYHALCNDGVDDLGTGNVRLFVHYGDFAPVFGVQAFGFPVVDHAF